MAPVPDTKATAEALDRIHQRSPHALLAVAHDLGRALMTAEVALRQASTGSVVCAAAHEEVLGALARLHGVAHQ